MKTIKVGNFQVQYSKAAGTVTIKHGSALVHLNDDEAKLLYMWLTEKYHGKTSVALLKWGEEEPVDEYLGVKQG